MTRIKTAIILLASIPMLGFAQLSGEFCYSFGFGSECIIFLDNNKFEYSYADCTVQARGHGGYFIKGKNLILHFEQDTTNYTENLVEIQKDSTDSDSISIEVKV